VDQRASGIPLDQGRREVIKLMNEIDDAMRTGEANAEGGVGGPYLLAFDRRRFDASGGPIVSFARIRTRQRVCGTCQDVRRRSRKLRTMSFAGSTCCSPRWRRTRRVGGFDHLHRLQGTRQLDLAVASPKMRKR